MKIFKFLGTTIALGLLLAACGGGSNTLTSPTGGGGGGGTSGVATVTVTASSASIAADGSTSSTITAVARDVNNAFVTGATITFSSTAGGLQVVSGTTDASGTATAKLSAQGAASGTAITVTATAGSISGNTIVSVVAIQQTLSVVTDMPQIPSDSSKSATISAFLKDANNNALAGVAVSFQSTSGALTVTQATTDASGVAKATLNAFNDPTNRRITVTATAGSAPAATVPIDVAGTSLTLTGPANLVLNNVGVYAIVLTDSSGRGIPNRAVALSSANGNTLSAPSVTTDATGKASVSVTAVSIANAGADTLSASALGLIATHVLTVSSQNFAITTPANNTTKVNLGVSQTITATWTSAGAPVVGQTVSFSATRGTLSAATAVTDANGVASVTISSTTAGPSVVAAAGTGVTAQVSLDFVATNPTQIAVQAAPAAVAIQGSSTITATVRDAQNNLVEGGTIDFVLTDSTGGTLSVASAVTDAQGRATTVYTAGSTTSAANGVIVQAKVQGTSVSGQATLTVGGQTVFLSLGTGNKIESPNTSQYLVRYAVQAVDAAGSTVLNVPVTLRVLPVNYVKGFRQYIGASSSWATIMTTPGVCANEDTDYSGNLTSLPNKDFNNNGTLEPGNVATVSPSSGVTDATGTLLVAITYPQDHAYYVTVQLVATTSVSGTQSSTSSTFLLPGAAADFTTQSTAPPGVVSPYGTATDCANPN